MKYFKLLVLVTSFLLIFIACKNNTTQSDLNKDDTITQQYNGKIKITVDEALSENADDHEDSNDYTWESTNVSPIFLNGDVITTSGWF